MKFWQGRCWSWNSLGVSCRWVGGLRRFGGMSCLNLQGEAINEIDCSNRNLRNVRNSLLNLTDLTSRKTREPRFGVTLYLVVNITTWKKRRCVFFTVGLGFATVRRSLATKAWACPSCIYGRYNGPGRAGKAKSVYRFTTGWTVRGSNPGGDEIFRTRPDRPWGPPSLLNNGYPVFLGGKAVGA